MIFLIPLRRGDAKNAKTIIEFLASWRLCGEKKLVGHSWRVKVLESMLVIFKNF